MYYCDLTYFRNSKYSAFYLRYSVLVIQMLVENIYDKNSGNYYTVYALMLHYSNRYLHF